LDWGYLEPAVDHESIVKVDCGVTEVHMVAVDGSHVTDVAWTLNNSIGDDFIDNVFDLRKGSA
jgi:hypothetical protein